MRIKINECHGSERSKQSLLSSNEDNNHLIHCSLGRLSLAESRQNTLKKAVL